MKNTVNVVNSLSTKAKVFTNLSNIEAAEVVQRNRSKDMDFSFGIKELNKNEIKLSVSKFSGSIILRKEMCLWIINTLRNASLDDYYTEDKKWENKKFNISLKRLLIKTSYFVRSTPYSHIQIYPCWIDEKKRSAPVTIPYNKAVPEILMSEFIEPVLTEFEKYVPEADKEKIAKSWNVNIKIEEYRKRLQEENKNPGQLNFNYVGEIRPDELFK